MGEPLRCSFCGKPQYEVRHLIAGPSALICDECVIVSVGICIGASSVKVAKLPIAKKTVEQSE